MQACQDAAYAAGDARKTLWKPNPPSLARKKTRFCARRSAPGPIVASTSLQSLASSCAASVGGMPHAREMKTWSPAVRVRSKAAEAKAGRPAARSRRSVW